MRSLLLTAVFIIGFFSVETRAATVNLAALSKDIATDSFSYLYMGGAPGRYATSMNMYDIVDVRQSVVWDGVSVHPYSYSFSVATGGLYIDDRGLTSGRVHLQSSGFTSIKMNAFATSHVSRVTPDENDIYMITTPIYSDYWGIDGKYLDIPLISINGRYYTDREINTGVYGGVPGVIKFESALPYLSLAAVRTGSVNADPSLLFDQTDFETVRVWIGAVTVVPLPAPFAMLGGAMVLLMTAGRKRKTRAADAVRDRERRSE